MQIQRCPECGGRLKTNYCDICLRKVPFKGIPMQTHVAGSSAHRSEKGHECVSFDDKKKPAQTTFRKPRKTAAPNKKGISIVAIVVAVLSLLPAIFGIIEDIDFCGDACAPEPEYLNTSDGFVEAGDFGAENIPNVIAEELYNANGIRLTADTAGLSDGSYTVFMTLQNDTNKKVSAELDMLSVNGFMVPFGAYQDVKAGKSEQLFLSFYNDELEKVGITQVSDITFMLRVYEANNYEEIVTDALITIRTDAEDVAEPVVDTSGLALYDDGTFCVTLRDVTIDEYGDCTMDLYLENTSEMIAEVYLEEATVKGQVVSTYQWLALRPNTRAIDAAYIYELDEMNITQLSQIDEITMELYVEYREGWDIMQSTRETVTFDPNEIF